MPALDPLHAVDLVNGRFRQTSRADLADLFNALRADSDRRDRIVVHFHGGLVSRESGAASAAALQPFYADADKGSAYPIFFLWNTFGADFVTGNFTDLIGAAARQSLFDAALRKLLAFVGQRAGLPADALAARAVGAPIPLADPMDIAWPQIDTDQIAEFERAFAEDLDIQVSAQQTIAAAPAGAALSLTSVDPDNPNSLLDPRILAAARQDLEPGDGGGAGIGLAGGALQLARHAGQVLLRVIQRFRAGRDHGVYHTVFEELMREFYLARIGEAVWGTMKKDAADAFGADPTCGGTGFLEELGTHLGQGLSPRITLVGHSAGAVYVAALLKAMDSAGLPPSVACDVVLMAPAVTFAQWRATIANHAGRIRNIQVLNLSEAREIADPCVPGLYKRSLLYLVCGAFEGASGDEPLLGMQRFHDPRFGDDVRAVLPTLAGKVVTAPSAQTDASHHGDFDDADLPTREHLGRLVRGGL